MTYGLIFIKIIAFFVFSKHPRYVLSASLDQFYLIKKRLIDDAPDVENKQK